jgi:hypothetical protein
MKAFFPSTSDQTRWPAALLSLLPFFLAGPVGIVISYQPDWLSRFLWILALSSLLVLAGFIAGAIRRFPRWAYPYPIYLVILINRLGTSLTYNLGLDFHLRNSFFLLLAILLVVLGLPGLRWFYRNILKDWTLLTYGLYGLALYLLATLDKDEIQHLSLLAVLPSLVSLCAALAHLRIRSPSRRVSVLLVGMYAGLILWLWPVFDGMSATWIGFAIVLGMLLLYAGVLTAILLAPLLILRLRRDAKTNPEAQQ